MELSFLENMGSQFSALIISPTENLNHLMHNVVGYFTQKDIPGLFICLNRSYASILEELKKNNIDTKNILFVDCAKSRLCEMKKGAPNVISVDTPADLTNLSISISEFAKNVPGEKFLAIDTISTLLIYNDENMVVRFVKALTEKTSGCGLKTIVLTQDNESLIRKISLFFDKTVNLNLTG